MARSCYVIGICANVQACIRKGKARSADHAELVHEQWLQAVRCGMYLFIQRVGTNENIADLPSREVSHYVVHAVVLCFVLCN